MTTDNISIEFKVLDTLAVIEVIKSKLTKYVWNVVLLRLCNARSCRRPNRGQYKFLVYLYANNPKGRHLNIRPRLCTQPTLTLFRMIRALMPFILYVQLHNTSARFFIHHNLFFLLHTIRMKALRSLLKVVRGAYSVVSGSQPVCAEA